MAHYEVSESNSSARGFACLLALAMALIIAGRSGAGWAGQAEGTELSREAPEPIGHGDGRIHIIPTLSAPSVKNGGKLTISAVVKALAGVREVVAEIRDGERVLDTIELQPGPAQSGGVGMLGAGSGLAAFAGPAMTNVGLWTAEWNAHGLEEKFYSVRLRVIDLSGHRFEDESLQFSDPVAGVTIPGSNSTRPNRVGAGSGLNGENYLESAVIDVAAGYAYFGTGTESWTFR